MMVALIVVGSVAGWAGYIWATSKTGFSWRRFTFRKDTPEIVECKGVVLFNGKPMKDVNGYVQLFPIDEDGNDDPLRSKALGPLDKEGRFTTFMNVGPEARREIGAFIGRYKVVVDINHPMRPGQLMPDRMLPDEYYVQSTTPLEVVVDESTEGQDIVLKLKGKLRPRPKPRGKKKRAKRKRPKAQPERKTKSPMSKAE